MFETAGDPVQLGLVASLNRQGGNVTGVTLTNVEVAPKRLELLHELFPTANVVAVLVNPSNANGTHTLGMELHVLNASTESDFDAVFTKVGSYERAG